MYEKYSVLFVDDEIKILNSLRRGLIDEAYTCFFASSGKEALEIMSKQKIAVLVTDMRMPEMDGLMLLNKVKEQWPKTVKIVLSGYTQLQQILVTINQVDIFKFITKPWKLEEEFIEIIHKALDYYILQEENEQYKKALEAKNQVYQNILKKMDDIIATAKENCENLGMLGRELLDFGSDIPLQATEKYKAVFQTKGTVFELFSKAVVSDKKEASFQVLTAKLTDVFSDDKMKVQFSYANVENDPVMMYLEMLEAVLRTCLTVFSREFLAFGLVVKLDFDAHKKLKVYLISPYAYKNSNAQKEQSELDIKMEFINHLMKKILHLYELDFIAVPKGENLLITVAQL